MRKLQHEEISRLAPGDITRARRHPIIVVLDNVRSLYNVGSIFRTSDAALIEKLFLTGITGTPENRGLQKTALGAQDTVPWAYTADPKPLVSQLKRQGHTIAVLEITDRPTPTTALHQSAFPLCLVVGNELTGVRDEIIQEANVALEIPQYGTKQSLNVAVAYGIAVYDLVRRFRAFL